MIIFPICNDFLVDIVSKRKVDPNHVFKQSAGYFFIFASEGNHEYRTELQDPKSMYFDEVFRSGASFIKAQREDNDKMSAKL